MVDAGNRKQISQHQLGGEDNSYTDLTDPLEVSGEALTEALEAYPVSLFCIVMPPSTPGDG